MADINATNFFGAGYKSVQQGTITISPAAGSGTDTISAVDATKAFVLYNGLSSDDTNAAITGQSFARVSLTNSTTVTANVGVNLAAGDTHTVAYTVVEPY